MIKQVIKYELDGRLFDSPEEAKEETSWAKISERAFLSDILCMEDLSKQLCDTDFRNYIKEFVRQSYADLFPDRDVVEAEGYRLPVALVPKFLNQVMRGFVESDTFLSEWKQYKVDEK